ncbi:MAG: 6-phosphogluconolactonase [Treponema sp.]|nr:6-phosphogluconolactonase [Treponema sp.]
MNITILEDENEVAEVIAGEIEELLIKKPDALICLCAGHSPVPVLNKLVLDAKQNKYPADRFKFISLDEWVGLGVNDKGSCLHDISKYFLTPLSVSEGERMFFFNGMSTDMEEECEKAKNFISKNGGLDLVLLGIGMNGHIGFNEPGTLLSDSVRVVELSGTSKTIGMKYFDRTHNLTKGITLGIKEIVEAKNVLVMVTGSHKQEVMERAVKSEPDMNFPFSLIRDYDEVKLYADKAAARKMTN